MNYLNKNPPLQGDECPNCGKRTWDIFKCDICDTISCKYCNELIIVPEDDDCSIIAECNKCHDISIFA